MRLYKFIVRKAETAILVKLCVVSFTLRGAGFARVKSIIRDSSGAAMILAGFLNIVLLRDVGADKVVRIICAIANFALLVFFVLLLMIFPEAHIFFGAGLFVAAIIFSTTSKHKREEII